MQCICLVDCVMQMCFYPAEELLWLIRSESLSRGPNENFRLR